METVLAPIAILYYRLSEIVAARWNPTDDVTLRALYADGVSLREIGDRLGRSARSVDERRRTLAISPCRHVPAWTAAEDRLVRAAAATDIPDRRLAQRLARPVEQVRRRRHLIVGARPAARRYSAAEDEQSAGLLGRPRRYRCTRTPARTL